MPTRIDNTFNIKGVNRVNKKVKDLLKQSITSILKNIGMKFIFGTYEHRIVSTSFFIYFLRPKSYINKLATYE
jgi:hypothetical protein